MFRLLLTLVFLCTPLSAAAPEAGTALQLESATVDVNIASDHSTSATVKLTIRNPGEALDVTLELADNLVPVKQHKEFALLVDGKAAMPAHEDNRFSWIVRVAETTQLEWTITGASTKLPHLHPLGRRELTVRLAHLRSFAALPEIVINVTHGLSAEQVGRTDAEPFSMQHPGGAGIQDFNLSWLDTTLKEKRAKLATTLEGFKDKQRTPDNREYTTTLAHAVDLAVLAEDHAAVAAHCEALAALEVAAGNAITDCGPWAKWRRYVPWQLLRLRALEALRQDAKECAKLAVAAMADRWPAYLNARKATRPFDEFGAKFGNYWDYDWQATRTLYARALEINGDAAAAKAVAGVED